MGSFLGFLRWHREGGNNRHDVSSTNYLPPPSSLLADVRILWCCLAVLWRPSTPLAWLRLDSFPQLSRLFSFIPRPVFSLPARPAGAARTQPGCNDWNTHWAAAGGRNTAQTFLLVSHQTLLWSCYTYSSASINLLNIILNSAFQFMRQSVTRYIR